MQLSRTLMGVAENCRDWSVALSESVDQLTSIFSTDVFETEGAAIDEQWAPLSRAYALRKQKKYGDVGILEATGDMKDSFQSSFDPTSAAIWNTAIYFKYHQSNQPRSKIPRRVMMKLTDSLKEMVVKNFQAQLLVSLGR